MKKILAVFVGGGIGACLRYYVASILLVYGLTFQSTLFINLFGCMFFGFITYIAIKRETICNPDFKLFLTTGIAGGFTTFSTFCFELVTMLQAGQIYTAAAYLLLSQILGLFAMGLGMFAARKVLLFSLNLNLIKPKCKIKNY